MKPRGASPSINGSSSLEIEVVVASKLRSSGPSIVQAVIPLDRRPWHVDDDVAGSGLLSC